MFLIAQDALAAAGRRNVPLRNWLRLWAASVEAAQWTSIADARKDYPHADGVELDSGTIVTVFNAKGGHWLLTVIYYDAAAVEVLAILTHAEYDKQLWKERY